jgi:hypothetical protein
LIQAFCKTLELSLKEVSNLKRDIDEGVFVPNLGQKADSICNSVNPLK